MRWRLAANLKWLFTEVPWAERFAAAGAAGFAAVELPDPYALPATQVRQLADDAGVATLLVNTPPGEGVAGQGVACDPGHTDQFRESFGRAVGYAQVLDAPFVHVVAGRRSAGVSHDRAFATYVHNLAWAAHQVRGTDLQILVEMQSQRDAPRFVLESQAQAAAVVEAAGDAVSLMLDVYHLQVQDGDVVTHLTKFLPLTRHIQIGDAPGRTEPGTGELSWPRISAAILASGYEGWLGCEFTPHDRSINVWRRVQEAL